MAVGEEDLEWAVRLALEVRRQGSSEAHRHGEFTNTHFSYTLGAEGVSSSSTPDQGGIGDEPLEC
ncbi:MAG: hypothetical protein R3E78_11720 [Burkholderiaceae bacterium]